MTAARTPEYVTAAEAADVMRCSTETVLRAIRRGDLPAVTYGRLRLIERADFTAFLAAHTTPAGQRPRRRHLRGA